MRLASVFAGLLLLLLPLVAHAAEGTPVRVRGTVEQLDGNSLRVTARAGESVSVTLAEGYQVSAVVALTPAESVDSYLPVDLTFGWDLGSLGGSALLQDLRLGLEVRNALDEDPPYVNLAPGANGSGGYDATASNPVGRLFAVSLRKAW